MSDRLEIAFAPLNADPETVTVVLAGDGLAFGARAREFDAKSAGSLGKAAAAADYKGKYKSSASRFPAPAKLGIDRLLIGGLGKGKTLSVQQYIDLGGALLGAVQSSKTSSASVIVDVEGSEDLSTEQIAALIAQGALLRHYHFKKYLTKKSGEDGASEKDALKKLVVHVAHPDKAKAAFQPLKAVANGVNLARDLVNEPANILGPVELAEKTKSLEKLGVEVEILDVKDMEKLCMGSLLCVGQGACARRDLPSWCGTAPKGRRSRSPYALSARASSSIPAASRSRAQPAWKT